MAKLIDLTGQKFGKLTVVGEAGRDKHRQAMWNCVCDCGNKARVRGYNLRKGVTTSCGCFHKETIAKLHETHGFTHTRLFGIWCGIKQRCYNPKDKNYAKYGRRGIIVCEA
jgi:hypothetical protein